MYCKSVSWKDYGMKKWYKLIKPTKKCEGVAIDWYSDWREIGPWSELICQDVILQLNE